jgi:hypothetical protein
MSVVVGLLVRTIGRDRPGPAVLDEHRIRCERAARAVLGGAPAEPFVDAPGSRVGLKDGQSQVFASGRGRAREFAEQRIVQLLRDARTPDAQGGAEMQELVSSGGGEPGHHTSAVDADVNVRRRIIEFLGPALTHYRLRERILLLREDVPSPAAAPSCWTFSNASRSSAVASRTTTLIPT